MFTLKQLKVFCSIASHSSISEAAKEQFLSVPAAWKHLQKLEDTCNTNLFLRTKNGLILSKSGEIFAQSIKPLLNEEKNVNNAIETIKTSKNIISIALAGTYQSQCFDLIDDFNKKHPNTNFDFTIGKNANEMEEILCNKNHDFVITGRNFNTTSYHAYELFKYHLTICTNIKNKIKNTDTSKNIVIFVPVSNPDWSKWVIDILKEKDFSVSIEYYNSFSTIKGIVKTGNGLGLLPDFLFENDSNISPFVSNKINSYVMLYQKKKYEQRQIDHDFTKFLINHPLRHLFIANP